MSGNGKAPVKINRDEGGGGPERRGARFFAQLFFQTFRLSAFTVGGGYVIVPLMKKTFVDRLHWIDEREMLDFVAIAQSSPGAMAVNASVLVGSRLAGLGGALTAIIGTVLPPLLLLSLIACGYEAFSSNAAVANALRGMQAGVCAVIIDVVYDMASVVVRKKSAVSIIVTAAAFIAVFCFKLNVIFVIIAAALTGYTQSLVVKRRAKSAATEKNDGKSGGEGGEP